MMTRKSRYSSVPKKSKPPETLSDYVRRKLREKNLSFMDIERLSNKGITGGAVNKILNHDMENLTARAIDALARGLGEPPEDILNIIIGRSPLTETPGLNALFYNYTESTEDVQAAVDPLIEVVNHEIDRRRKKP